MQRYFIEQASVQLGDTVYLSSEDSRHLLKVMRGQVGDEVMVVTTQAKAYYAALSATQEQVAPLRIISELEGPSVELPVNVTIACGLSKHDKVEWIVQKATECGMTDFVPLSLTRDIVKWDGKKAAQRVERLQKIAKEAAEQSHRVVIPQVQSLHSLKLFIQTVPETAVKLIAYEETAKTGTHHQLATLVPKLKVQQPVVVVFGSEGGLTEQEVLTLESAGFVRCSLGPRILRAETAPIYLLSALSYALELQI